MKMVRTGKLNSEEKEEGGKKTIYILLDKKTEEEVKNGIVPIELHTEKTIKEDPKLRIQKILASLMSSSAEYCLTRVPFSSE